MQVSQPTNSIILTFHSTQLPETVLGSFYRLDVRLYVPPPIRCKKCQVYDHTKKYCTNDEICPICCGAPDHPANQCHNIICRNCKSNEHQSWSNMCPVFKENKEINYLKPSKKITYYEAKKLNI